MRALRISFYLLVAPLLGALALAGALWLWSGSGSSLATSLGQLARYLPAGQTLQAKDVTGSLRGGGRIGWLRWQRGEFSVELVDVTIAWSLRPLLGGELRLGQVAVRHLRIEDRRSTTPPAATPPTHLRLPLKVDVPFSVETVEFSGPGGTSLQANGLAGHYIFDSYLHRLDGGQLHISSGNYQISASLQAASPMALSVQVNGSVPTTVPSRAQPVMVQAHATLVGALAGRDAALALQAELVPTLKAALNGSPQAMQASVSARIQPWQLQPVASLEARWQALDLAALWPQAPQTRLAGTAVVHPAGPGWQAGLQLTNTLSGPWDQQRLPLQQLDAKVEFVDGQWAVKSMQASGAGGRIEGQGKFTAAAAPSAPSAFQWQGSATIHGINTAALDSRLAAAQLDGELTAQQTARGIAFETRLQAAKGKNAANKTAVSKMAGAKLDATLKRTLDGLRLQSVQAQGLWAAPTLTLTTLAVQTDDAQLQGKLTFHTVSQAAEGQLNLSLPGAQAALAGHMASSRGQGDMSLRVTDAALASRWVARLPGAPSFLSQTSMQGGAELTGRWQGGWQQQGQGLQIEASLRAPKLDLQRAGQPPQQAWRLRDGQADLSGTLRALSLSTRGQIETGTQRLKLQAQAHAGRITDGLWQARLDAAQLSVQDTLKPGLWTLQLSDSVSVNWKQSGTTRTLEVAAGAARLTGPVPGTAGVSWQPVRWSQQTTGATARTDWRTQGRINDLPLAWLDLLGQSQMTNLGLRGDLLFGGQWDATSAETLRLRATLERTSGDLLLQTEGAAATPVRAGVRAARLLVTTEGDRLAASLNWDSERAGQAQADFSTRLQHQNGSWSWPADAALAGRLKVQLPPVGAWSLLAPPGWRLRGTLDADAVLSGTRNAPQWRGNLAAQDLAVRSVVDGIDFSNGRLRASLQGQRLSIDEFTLQGAGGVSGGQLSATGSVLWLPAAGPDAKTVAHLRLEIDATLAALRVSARADRRLVVSGTLSARLNEAKLAIRGNLTADAALFILPEDTTPQLGDDVLVRRPGKIQAGTAPAKTAAPSAAADQRMTPDVAITLDLGQDFQVRGRGLATRLAGSLALRSAGRNLTPSLTGALRTVRGTYRAYGQQLAIEQGVLRFFGPYANPALDILALRPNLQQRVGVQISGTALSPVVRLYAEPDLPESEKLAWLVLGRSGASGGAETAMLQQAALALLGGNQKGISSSLAQALGLDELSVSGGASSTNGSSTGGATVTLGKRVSQDFYVAYERSLAGTLGTLSIFYDLSRRFTLRAQTGEKSAVDLIFTIRYD
ncbi:translocation/assembly module TamB domain-containing protein [Rhodoferax sp.]|uniref:translocation/assembly module TamB domain-containing protein n=1 Tax=Rhodoferax sp. TaxID=50421 RepID=UPI00374D4928